MRVCVIIYAVLIPLSSIHCAEETSKLSKESQAIIDKALDANLAAPSKAYDAYQKSLADASAKTLKDLEKIKADANDTKKGSMSFKERSALIDVVESTIAEVKKGSLGERIVAKSGGDLLGDVGGFKSGKDVILHLTKNPKWKSASGKILTIDARQMRAQWIEGGKVMYNAEVVVEKSVIRWGNCKIDFAKSDGKTVEFIWPAGEMEILTVVDSE
jgi:hypothetical protein